MIMNETLFLDKKYLSLLSSQLPKFKAIRSDLFVCRCTKCGDSAKKTNKRRMYFYYKKGHINVFCHNCSYSSKFSWFLKDQDPALYNEYSMDLFSDQEEKEPPKPIPEVLKPSVTLKGLTKISSLYTNHPGKLYVISRKIPSRTHYKLFYTSHFAKWVNERIPNHLYDGMKIDPRLVLPLIDRDDKIFGVIGRDMTNKSPLRYITIRFDDTKPKIYGLDTVDPNYRIYVTEGAIDSLYLPNCIAMAGADVSVKDMINEINPDMDKSRLVFVYDNEKRNPQVVKRIENKIETGYNVVLYPKSFLYKDLNEAIMKGMDEDDLIEMIGKNTYSGLKAELAFGEWRKT